MFFLQAADRGCLAASAVSKDSNTWVPIAEHCVASNDHRRLYLYKFLNQVLDVQEHGSAGGHGQ